jgi:hypothetical protein
MNELTIATWNLQSDKEMTQNRADAFRLAMEEIKADVWVITEPLLTFSPGADYRLVSHSGHAADLEMNTDPRWAADRRWVAIWSRLPARKIEVLREPDRMACVRVERPSTRDVVIVGTVLPWPSDPKWPGSDGKRFCDAIEYQAVEWKRLLGTPQTAGVCVSGDFNQSLPYTPHFGPEPSEKAFRKVLSSLALVCVTGDDMDPLPKMEPGSPSIDHLCVGGGLQSLLSPPSRTWNRPSKPNSSDPITDHFGVAARLGFLE